MSDNLKRLVETLGERGVKSPVLQRLRSSTEAARAHALAGVQQEVMAEMAAALGRSGQRVDEELLKLELCRDDLERARDRWRAGLAGEEDVRRRVTAYNQQRDAAFWRIENLKVQREAFGLRDHRMVKEQYPLPPPATFDA